MTRFHTQVATIGLILVLAGCAARGGADYFPLVPGAERTMRIWTQTIAGPDTSETARVRLAERVVGEEDVKGMGRLWVIEQPADSGPPMWSYFRRTRDAVLQVMVNNAGDTAGLKFLSLPLRKGLKWTFSEAQGLQSEVIGFDSLIIGSDTFPDCFEIVTESERMEWVGRMWLAPNIGPVKWENRVALTGPDGQPHVVTNRGELVSYRLPETQQP